MKDKYLDGNDAAHIFVGQNYFGDLPIKSGDMGKYFFCCSLSEIARISSTPDAMELI